jgi:hypothetical protein
MQAAIFQSNYYVKHKSREQFNPLLRMDFEQKLAKSAFKRQMRYL